MQIVTATEQKRSEIKDLLQSQKLPTEDLPNQLTYFYTALHGVCPVSAIVMKKDLTKELATAS